ncbi:MAG: glycosyltransferase family 2 protein [Desulfatibacillaceae bacterium]
MERQFGKPPDRHFVRHRNNEPPPAEWVAVVTDNRGNQTEPPLVTVVVPTADAWRDGKFPELMRQLSHQDFQDFERVVIQGDNRQGRAINSGAALARGRYMLTLDDDSSLGGPDVVGKLVRALEADPDVGMAGGINTIPDDAPFLVRRAMEELPRRDMPDVAGVTDSDMAEHPLLMMRLDAFRQVGGENEVIPRGLDPYLREEFRRVGYRVVVVPGACYTHMPPGTMRGLVRQFYRNGAQSAYCSLMFPEWAYETPDRHGPDVVMKRPLWYRVVRKAAGLAGHALRGHVVYVAANGAYSLGFLSGYLRAKQGKKP